MAGRSLGSLTLDLVLKMGGFVQGMDKAARVTDQRMREIEARAKKFGVAIGAAVAAAGVAAAAGVKSAIDYADQLNDMNQRLGVSAEALSGWAYAAKQSGTDIDALGVGLKKLAKNMAEALDPKTTQGKLFDALGVSVKDAEGRLRDVEDVLPEIAGKFKDLDNATQESALAMDLFGKSGTDLLEFLNQGSDGLETLRDRARDLGVELDGNTLQAADQFNDTLADIKTISEGLFAQLARELLPSLQDVANYFRDGASAGDGFGGTFKFIGEQVRLAIQDVRGIITVVQQSAVVFAEFFNQLATAQTMAKNIGTFGLAEGTIAGAWRESDRSAAVAKKAIDDLELSYNGLTRAAYNAQVATKWEVNVPGLAKPSTFPQMPFNFAEDQSRGKKAPSLESSLAKFYGGDDPRPKSGGKSKSIKGAAEDATKALREQVEAVVRAREEFDSMAASLSGPLAEAAYRFSVEQQRLNDLAKTGEVDATQLAEAQANLRKEYELNVESIKRQLDPIGMLLDDYEFENSLLGMTNAQRQVAIDTRGMDADAIAKQSAALGKLEAAYRQGEQIREQIGLMDEFRDSVSGIFSDIRDGASAWDAVKDAFDNFADAIFDFASKKVMEQLFGQMGTTQTGSAGGGWLSLFTTALGAFSGGGAGAGAAGAGSTGYLSWMQGGYAAGGLMPANSMARVNENGPELMTVKGRDYLMTGSDAVTITPNHKLGGSGSGTVVQNFYNPRMYDRRSDTQRQAEAAMKIQRATRFA